jgi:hypothetical protein
MNKGKTKDRSLEMPWSSARQNSLYGCATQRLRGWPKLHLPQFAKASLPQSFRLLYSVSYPAFLRTLKLHVSCVFNPLLSVATILIV